MIGELRWSDYLGRGHRDRLRANGLVAGDVSFQVAVSYLRYMRKLPLAIAVVVLLTFPALGHAQGNSAIDQYTEGVPDAGGDSLDASGAGGSGDSGSAPAQPTPSETGTEAEAPSEPSEPSEPAESGAAGQNDSDNGDGSASPAGGSGGAQRDKPPANGEATPTTAIGGAAADPAADGDSGGIGALPIVLAITLLAAVGYAVYEWMRRRPSRPISNPSA